MERYDLKLKCVQGINVYRGTVIAEMYEHPAGDWIKWEDHETEASTLGQIINRCNSEYGACMAEVGILKAEIIMLKDELKHANHCPLHRLKEDVTECNCKKKYGEDWPTWI